MNEITLETGFNMKAEKVKSFKQIKSCKRLFYELVYNYNVRTGFFKEIKNVAEFIKFEKYFQKNNIKYNCSFKSYIDHHNFHVIND